MTETTLKQQARRFVKEHNVSYTRALAAVDEPLHRLRAELTKVGGWRRPGFQLTDSEDELLEPVSSGKTDDHYAYLTRKIRGTEFKPYVTRARDPEELVLEMARRISILQESNCKSIWDHRMLYRAGLTSHPLEPTPYYYQRVRGAHDLMLANNNLGIVEVSVLQDSYFKMHKDGDEMPFGQASLLRFKKITHTELLDLLDPTGARSAVVREEMEADRQRDSKVV